MDSKESPRSVHNRNPQQAATASHSLQITKQISKETKDQSLDYSTPQVQMADFEASGIDDRELIENLEDKPNNNNKVSLPAIADSASPKQPSKSIFRRTEQDQIQENLNRSKSGTLSDSSRDSGQIMEKHSGLEDEDDASMNKTFENSYAVDKDGNSRPILSNQTSFLGGCLTNNTEKRLPSSLINVFGDDKMSAINAIPEAMPLIRRISLINSREPDMYKKAQRGQTYHNIIQEQKEPCCEHDARIDNWKCSLCKSNISKFNIVFDDASGRVSTFTKIVYENQFLSDFKQEFKSLAAQKANPKDQGGIPQSVLVYQAYQPNNILELKEYMFMIMCRQIKKVNKAAKGDSSKASPFGTGMYQNLSGRLLKYLMQQNEREKRLRMQFGKNILLFDSKFESGNLLQAEKCAIYPNTYNLFMQVDTNTRGHQQWFYFKVKGGIKGKTYTFNIMNFTKPGVTGGRGYKSGEHNMRVMVRSKKRQIERKDFENWDSITNENKACEYVKTNVARRKKDVIAAGADSDQEDWVEEAFNKPPPPTTGAGGTAQAGPQIPVINVNGPENQTLRQGETGQPPKEKTKKRKVFYYYALKFQYKFLYDDDSVYFSFSQPVTYTDILTDLHRREKQLLPRQVVAEVNNPKPADESTPASRKMISKTNKSSQKVDEEQRQINFAAMIKQNQFQKNIYIDNPNKLIYYQRTEFCKTLSGIPLYKIVISRDYKACRKNQIVLITSRVHSGETPGSQVFKGIYEFITSDTREAKYLRRFYTFVFIPCMNPDGVICGNYRNSLAGIDLNRQWINPEPEFHPEVCAVKGMMQKIKEEDKRQIWIFCDLHGHSKKKNSFFYGCNTAANGGFLSWTIVRLLPRIFAQKTHMFNYKDCKFRVEPYKIGTARIVAWKQFSITHSFTLENSFYGYDIGEEDSRIYTHDDYRGLGYKFAISIYEMHFLWKQIKRELQITHGWLKPRTLNEMTGVPAAQIIAEEAAQVKEEERKKKAIEQYEQFLNVYYKNNKDNLIKRKQFIYRVGAKSGAEPSEKPMPEEEESKADVGKSRNKAAPQTKTFTEEKELDPTPRKKQPLLDTDRRRTESNQKSFKMPRPKPEESIEIAKSPVQRVEKSEDPNPENPEVADPEEELDENESEFVFKMHQGLVKIQALIRGFLERQRFKKRPKRKPIHHPESEKFTRQRSNQLLKNSSSKKFPKGKYSQPSKFINAGYDTSSEGRGDLTASKAPESNLGGNDSILRSNTEQIAQPKNLSDSGGTTNKSQNENPGASFLNNLIGGLPGGNGPKAGLNLNWREYFEGDELDKAYQIVEVEQRDETDANSEVESMGSNSNPSEDNLDEEDVYRNVFGVQNPEQIIEQRKQMEIEFQQKVIQEVQTQAEVIEKLVPKPEEKPEPKVEAPKPPVKQKQKLLKIKKAQVSNIDLSKQPAEPGLNLKAPSSHTVHNAGKKEDNGSRDAAYTRGNTNPNPENLAQVMGKNASIQNLQKSANHSPKQQKNEIQQDNLFSNINYSGIRRMIKSSNQQRAFTQQQQMNQPPNAPGSGKTGPNNQTYKIQQPYGHKKENINQVIKDCFITKKMATKATNNVGSNPSAMVQTKNGQITISPQKQMTKKQNTRIKLQQSGSKGPSSAQASTATNSRIQDLVMQLAPLQNGKLINFQNLSQKQQSQLLSQIQKQQIAQSVKAQQQNQMQIMALIQQQPGGEIPQMFYPTGPTGPLNKNLNSQQYIQHIQETIQQQNMYLLQHIVQNNLNQQLNNLHLHQKQKRNRQNNSQPQIPNQGKVSEALTNQFLAKINKQITGLNSIQTNQYLQVLLTQQIQQQQKEEQTQVKNLAGSALNKDISNLTEQNLLFYPQGQQEQPEEGSQALTDLVQLFDSSQLVEADIQKVGMPSVKRGDLNLVSSDIHEVLDDHEKKELTKKFENSPMAVQHRYSLAHRADGHFANNSLRLQNQGESEQSNLYGEKGANIFYKSTGPKTKPGFIGQKPPSASAARKHSAMKKESKHKPIDSLVENSMQNMDPHILSKQNSSQQRLKNLNRVMSQTKDDGEELLVSEDVQYLNIPVHPHKSAHKKQSQKLAEHEHLQQSDQHRLGSQYAQAQSQQNLGSSLFMKYVKKKASQQYNMPHMPPDSSASKEQPARFAGPDGSQTVHAISKDLPLFQFPTQQSFLQTTAIGGQMIAIPSTEDPTMGGDQEETKEDRYVQFKKIITPQKVSPDSFAVPQPTSSSVPMTQKKSPYFSSGLQAPPSAVNSGQDIQDSTVLSQEIVNTKELLNEIKQMRVHQQQQIQLQKQLQYQLQRQLEMQNQVLSGPQLVTSHDLPSGMAQGIPQGLGQGLGSGLGQGIGQGLSADGSPLKGQPVFVQYNQINFFDQQQQNQSGAMPQSQPLEISDYVHPGELSQDQKGKYYSQEKPDDLVYSPGDFQMLQTQQAKFVMSEIQREHPKVSATEKKRHRAKDHKQVALQAEDKIPVGLQALMNRQQNMHQILIGNQPQQAFVNQQRKNYVSLGKYPGQQQPNLAGPSNASTNKSAGYYSNPTSKSKKHPAVIQSDHQFQQSSELSFFQRSEKKKVEARGEGGARIDSIIRQQNQKNLVMKSNISSKGEDNYQSSIRLHSKPSKNGMGGQQIQSHSSQNSHHQQPGSFQQSSIISNKMISSQTAERPSNFNNLVYHSSVQKKRPTPNGDSNQQTIQQQSLQSNGYSQKNLQNLTCRVKGLKIQQPPPQHFRDEEKSARLRDNEV